MRKRKRLRVDRILYCLAILILIISLIKLGISSIINYNIYKSAENENLIKISGKSINVWTKTINFINDKVDEITIKHNKHYVTIYGNALKNHMNVELNTYTTTVDTKPFTKQKGYYIKETDILSIANKVKIKLPWSLNRRDEVDIYGVKNGKYRIYRSRVKVVDKYITFEPSEDFKDYFITYVPLKNITMKNKINVEVGDEIILNYKFSPSNATNKSISFKQSKKILTINGSKITANKAGETTLTVTNKNSGISTSVKIKITKPEPVSEPEPEPVSEPTPQNNTVTQVDGLYYVDGILLANKSYPLTSSYDPGDLLDEFYSAFYNMQAAAELDGIQLWIQSGYRDYETQEIIYNRYVASDGQELADTYSARPGYSEHQTGLAADINNPSDSFNDTPEAKWLEDNCVKYGFIIRFPRGKESSTGYQYESWHIRYVGVEKAKAITDSGLSLEEYYGITSVYQ